ncbi:MAG TPA: response regulator transcription factor [Candidatus Acidoferrales bacterium]|nr:response regulator transcription factor [Candidatus Acidoferrales bacterium]
MAVFPTTMSSLKAFRVLIADDQDIVRRGLRALLEAQRGYEICGEASSGPEAIEMAKQLKPDMLIIDVTMKGLNGLEVIHTLRQESPELVGLVHTIHISERLAREVMRSGAMGYVLKSDGERELLTAVEQLRNGRPYFNPQLTATMAETFLSLGEIPQEGEGNGEFPLTERELGVLQMLAEGKSNKEVATAMNVSVRTVESHRNRIMQKMQFGSFSDLVRFAVRNSIVAP